MSEQHSDHKNIRDIIIGIYLLVSTLALFLYGSQVIVDAAEEYSWKLATARRIDSDTTRCDATFRNSVDETR
jgi:hypothetical protein